MADHLQDPTKPPLADRLAVVCLAAVIGLTLIDVFTTAHWVASLAVPFLLAYLALQWGRLILNARILLALCAVLAVYVAWQPEGMALLGTGASRMIYFPAFVALLGLLRAAASASPMVAKAGRHLINQRPNLRYLALSFGGHFFGILFNIGGLALLVDMTKRANTLAAAGGDPQVMRWRERRMTTAITRGFACIVFWSPLGVAMNMTLAFVPAVEWQMIAPAGILVTLGIILLGWAFDYIQRPAPLGQTRDRAVEPGGARAVAALVGHVLAMSAVTGAADFLTHWPFQTALLVVVPAYAVTWMLAGRLLARDPQPLRAAGRILLNDGFGKFPSFANEIAVFGTSAFLGVVLVAIVPRAALQALLTGAALPPGVMATAIMVGVTVLGIIGLNPMISVAILGGILASVEIPGLSPILLVFALQIGWGLTVTIAPLNSSLLMTAGILGRSALEVGPRWNGAYAMAVLLLSAAAFMLIA